MFLAAPFCHCCFKYLCLYLSAHLIFPCLPVLPSVWDQFFGFFFFFNVDHF